MFVLGSGVTILHNHNLPKDKYFTDISRYKLKYDVPYIKKKDTQNFNDLKYLQVKNHILLHFYAAPYSFYTYFSLYVNRRAKVR